jgi:hypothetical protein
MTLGPSLPAIKPLQEGERHRGVQHMLDPHVLLARQAGQIEGFVDGQHAFGEGGESFEAVGGGEMPEGRLCRVWTKVSVLGALTQVPFGGFGAGLGWMGQQ